MNAFGKRYFVVISLVLLVFTAISFEIKNLIFFPLFVFILVILFSLLSKFKNKIKNLRVVFLLLLCAAMLGIFSSRLLVIKNDRMENRYSGQHNISGYVIEVSSNQSFMSEYIVRVESVDSKKVSFDMVLVADYQCDLSRGDFFALTGNLLPLDEYDELIYLKNKNAYDYPIVCAIDNRVEIEFYEREFRISLMLSNINSKLSSTLKAIMGSDNGALASALLLGNRELLSDNTLRDFKRAGVYHMLALSGLHVAILIGIIDWLLKKLFTPRAMRICVLTFLSLFYVALTGFALSACRSMLMLWLMYLALTLGRKRDALTALFFAVSVIVLINPSAILDIGLQLSFLSTFGVISATIIGEKIRWLKKDINNDGFKSIVLRMLRKLALLNLASLCVFILTLPVLMIYFGEVSLATFVTNIFMGVICEIFMIFSLITLLFSWSIHLRLPFVGISSFIGEMMTRTVSFISNLEGVMLSLSYPRIEALAWGLFFGFLLLFSIRLTRKWHILIPSVIFAILLPINIVIYGASRQEIVRAEYLAGDTLVLSSANEVYICDASNGAYGNLYDGVALAKDNCFTEIDGIILTHYHSKHIVSIERLSKNYKIHSVFLPQPQNYSEDLVMRSIIRVLDDERVKVYIYDNEQDLDILSGKLAVSPRAYIAGYAHPSVALSFEYKDERITLLGRPYFSTYLEKSGVFKDRIENSDYLIFGSDGRDVKKNFDIFSNLKNGCEISFSDFELMNKSDFENYIDDYKIYFDVEYKKYDLK